MPPERLSKTREGMTPVSRLGLKCSPSKKKIKWYLGLNWSKCKLTTILKRKITMCWKKSFFFFGTSLPLVNQSDSRGWRKGTYNPWFAEWIDTSKLNIFGERAVGPGKFTNSISYNCYLLLLLLLYSINCYGYCYIVFITTVISV